MEEVRGGEDDGFASGLPYDDEAAAALEKDTASSKGKGTGEDDTGFAAVEARWDTLRRITDQSQVSAGATVAWKVSSAVSASSGIELSACI